MLCATCAGKLPVAEWWRRQRYALLWWALAVGLAVTLKYHFSVAAASELNWMLRPVSLLLRLVAGWQFERSDSGEWYSLDAGIVLIKACAGINFMIMSLLGWCWILRPRVRDATARVALIEWPLLLGGALVFAWSAALVVNSLRILAIVHWQPLLEHWLPSGQAHRMIGLLIYLPALNLQLLLAERRRWPWVVLLACGLYAGMMIVVPLLTGNAAAKPVEYVEHALTSLVVLVPVAASGFVWRWLRIRLLTAGQTDADRRRNTQP
jgi:exosortase K